MKTNRAPVLIKTIRIRARFSMLYSAEEDQQFFAGHIRRRTHGYGFGSQNHGFAFHHIGEGRGGENGRGKVQLLIYVLRKMKVTKTECKQLITAYNAAKEALRSEIPTSVWNQILGSATRSNMNMLTAYIINS